jgi:hypothetical protein
MEASVNLSSDTLRAKSHPLITRALATPSADGKLVIVQVSALIRAPLLALVAYVFCPDQSCHRITMEENSVNTRSTLYQDVHSHVLEWGVSMPAPLKNRESIFKIIFRQLSSTECVISSETLSLRLPPISRNGAVSLYAKRLARFTHISPTITRLTVTSTFDTGGSIPRVITSSFAIPAAACGPINALRYFNQTKPAEAFEAADGRELGQLLVLDAGGARGGRQRRPLEARLARLVDRHAVLRGARGRYPWFSGMLAEVLRNQAQRKSSTRVPLAEFGEVEGRRVGGAFALFQLTKVSPAAAVEAWMSGNPAIGDLKRE